MLERLGGGDGLLAETFQIRETKNYSWDGYWMICRQWTL